MVVHSRHCGHAMYLNEHTQEWKYADNDSLVKDNHKKRPCGKCSKFPTQEGHDSCLKTLPNVKNACCGHGVPSDAYIQFNDGVSIHGIVAVRKQQSLKGV